MIFNSVTFLIFLLFVVCFYWNLEGRTRQVFLFSFSMIFYGFWRFDFVPLIIFSILVDFFIAQKIETSLGSKKKLYLKLSIFVNLSLLAIFKYLIFFTESVYSLISFFGLEINPIVLNVVLPVGISFYTFQTISYTVDVYRGIIKPEKNIFYFANYVSFFPQLVAGPILRAREVLPQLFNRPSFSWSFIHKGLKRIIYGIFLKVVLADNIAPLVDDAFALDPKFLNPLDVVTMSFLFGFQIYFDFSAYSHIAIGSAYLMGIKFPENFNFPYMSTSPRDFWKKWHISLSSWIRDYLYLPLAKVRVGHYQSNGGLPITGISYRFTKSLILTWAIMGFWHGANWTFILWGLVHAIIIIIYKLILSFELQKIINEKSLTFLGFCFMLPIMMLAWIPFRSDSVNQSYNLVLSLFSFERIFNLGLRENNYLIAALLLLSHIIVYYVSKFNVRKHMKETTYYLVESFLLAILIATSFIFLRPINQFIYFQF